MLIPVTYFRRKHKETKFIGWLRVKKAEEEIMFGHDECIFKHFHTTTKSWRAHNGETVIIPKGNGQGVMISGFQARCHLMKTNLSW
jgi:hypothetical protein